MTHRNEYGRVLGILNYKGGSGKTTLAIHIAGFLSSDSNHYSTTLIDSDDDGVATAWYNARTKLLADAGHSNPLGFHRVDPNRPYLSTLEDVVIDARTTNDFVVIDSKGGNTHEVNVTLEHSDILIIPCAPEFPDLKILPNTYRDFLQENAARAERGVAPLIGIVVMNRVMDRYPNSPNSDVGFAKARIEAACPEFIMYPGFISRRVSFHRALDAGKHITEWLANGKEDLAATMEIMELVQFVRSQIKSKLPVYLLPTLPAESQSAFHGAVA